MRKTDKKNFSPKNHSSHREQNEKRYKDHDDYRNIDEINNESQSAYSKNAVKININIDYFVQCISLWCPLIRGMFFKGMDTEVFTEHSSTCFHRYQFSSLLMKSLSYIHLNLEFLLFFHFLPKFHFTIFVHFYFLFYFFIDYGSRYLW